MPSRLELADAAHERLLEWTAEWVRKPDERGFGPRRIGTASPVAPMVEAGKAHQFRQIGGLSNASLSVVIVKRHESGLRVASHPMQFAHLFG